MPRDRRRHREGGRPAGLDRHAGRAWEAAAARLADGRRLARRAAPSSPVVGEGRRRQGRALVLSAGRPVPAPLLGPRTAAWPRRCRAACSTTYPSTRPWPAAGSTRCSARRHLRLAGSRVCGWRCGRACSVYHLHARHRQDRATAALAARAAVGRGPGARAAAHQRWPRPAGKAAARLEAVPIFRASSSCRGGWENRSRCPSGWGTWSRPARCTRCWARARARAGCGTTRRTRSTDVLLVDEASMVHLEMMGLAVLERAAAARAHRAAGRQGPAGLWWRRRGAGRPLPQCRARARYDDRDPAVRREP